MSMIAFLVPLPPAALRSNSRAPWYVRTKAKQVYSEAVYQAACENFHTRVAMALSEAVTPWMRARVTYEWRYCGVAPDEANLGANTKALQDILCRAPDNGLQRNETTYLGLVEDDKGIVPKYAMVRVRHRAETGVYVTVERLVDADTPRSASEA